MLLIISSAIQQNFNPFFASNYTKGKIEYINKSIKKLLKFTLLSIIPIYIISVTIYHVYVNNFLSADFFNTTSLFAVMCVGIAISFVFGWSVTMLPMAGLLNINLLRIVIGCVFNVILLFIFTKLFAVKGAILANSLTHIFQVIMSLYFVNRFLKINVLKLAILSIKRVNNDK